MFNISESNLLSDSRAELLQQLRQKDNESVSEGESLSNELIEFGMVVGWLLLGLLIFTIILSIHRCPTWMKPAEKASMNEKHGYQTTTGERSINEKSTMDDLDNFVSQLTDPIKDVNCISSIHLENPPSDRKSSESNTLFIRVPESDKNIEFDIVQPIITPFIRRRIGLLNQSKNREMLNIRSTGFNSGAEEKGSLRNIDVLEVHKNVLQDELPLTPANTETSRLSNVSVNSHSTSRFEMTETLSDGGSLKVLKTEQSELT